MWTGADPRTARSWVFQVPLYAKQVHGMVAPAWGLHGIGGNMFDCCIIYSPSGCLFDSCAFQSLPPRRYQLEVPVWDLRHVEKYSTPQRSCSEPSAAIDFQDSLSISLSGFLSSHFTVVLCFFHFLASSSERSLGDIRRDGSVKGCSAFKRLKCSTRAPGDVDHLVSASSGVHVFLSLSSSLLHFLIFLIARIETRGFGRRWTAAYGVAVWRALAGEAVQVSPLSRSTRAPSTQEQYSWE